MQHKSVKLLMLAVTVVALMSIFFAACSRTEAPTGSANATSTTSTQGGNTGSSSGSTPTAAATATTTTQGGNTGGASGGTEVHMNDANFVKGTVTISKGGSLLLIDDSTVPHIIQNGTWNNGTAQPSKEAGAPTVQVQFQGSDQHSVGPFATAGTFHLYCIIHPGMNLTVTVQ
ncbi:MAG TPA: hypothetical protein VFU49_22205 [Ktedonobacteraceae bacterium]|nr:hypothetical protein [Ktedonobacteraceae bacterium]